MVCSERQPSPGSTPPAAEDEGSGESRRRRRVRKKVVDPAESCLAEFNGRKSLDMLKIRDFKHGGAWVLCQCFASLLVRKAKITWLGLFYAVSSTWL
jgi:hypothetical protein